MIFSKDAVNGCWKWRDHSLPKVSCYFGIDFSRNGAWDIPINKLLDNGIHCTKKVNQLHKVIDQKQEIFF